MIRFIISRLLQGLVVVVAVISLAFLIIRGAPGSPFAWRSGPEAMQTAALVKGQQAGSQRVGQGLNQGEGRAALERGQWLQAWQFPAQQPKRETPSVR